MIRIALYRKNTEGIFNEYKHPFIVFKKPIRQAHVRVRDHNDPDRILWDVDFVFKEPTKYLSETMPPMRGWFHPHLNLFRNEEYGRVEGGAFASLAGAGGTEKEKHGLLRFPKLCGYASSEEEYERLKEFGRWNAAVLEKSLRQKLTAGITKVKEAVGEFFLGSSGAAEPFTGRPHPFVGKPSVARKLASARKAKMTAEERAIDAKIAALLRSSSAGGSGSNLVKNSGSITSSFPPPSYDRNPALKAYKNFKTWSNMPSGQSEPVLTDGVCADPFRPCQVYEMIVTTNFGNPRLGQGEALSLEDGPQLPAISAADYDDSGAYSFETDTSLNPTFADNAVVDRLLFGVQAADLRHDGGLLSSVTNAVGLAKKPPRPLARDVLEAELMGEKTVVRGATTTSTATASDVLELGLLGTDVMDAKEYLMGPTTTTSGGKMKNNLSEKLSGQVDASGIPANGATKEDAVANKTAIYGSGGLDAVSAGRGGHVPAHLVKGVLESGNLQNALVNDYYANKWKQPQIYQI
eukprot:g4258.t1